MHRTYGVPGVIIVSTVFRIVIVALAVFGCLGAAPAAAHPPSSVIPEYDGAAGLLSVTITHDVPNPDRHYIGTIQISVNGKVVNETSYTGQPSTDIFTVTYPLAAQPGDQIAVTARCNLAGSGTGTLTVPAGSGTMEMPAATKAAGGIAPVILAGVLLVLAKRR